MFLSCAATYLSFHIMKFQRNTVLFLMVAALASSSNAFQLSQPTPRDIPSKPLDMAATLGTMPASYSMPSSFSHHEIDISDVMAQSETALKTAKKSWRVTQESWQNNLDEQLEKGRLELDQLKKGHRLPSSVFSALGVRREVLLHSKPDKQ